MKLPRVRVNHLRVRLAVASSTLAFGLGLFLASPRTPPKPSDVPCEKSGASKQVSTQTTPDKVEAQDAKPTRVGQQEVVTFPGVGRVRVTAYETEGSETRLVFQQIDSGKELININMSNESFNPSLRFRVMHVKGLPDPLVVGVSVSPGGSDSGWEAAAFGAVGGELRHLTRNEDFQSGDKGGFYFGDLGGGRGLGAAVWDFVWDFDYESHLDSHQYEIKLYKWNRVNARFEWERVFRTQGKFDSYKPALRSVGLRFGDVRAGIHEFDYLDKEN
jgi:hypothetical protein